MPCGYAESHCESQRASIATNHLAHCPPRLPYALAWLTRVVGDAAAALYTIWTTGSIGSKVFAVAHCALGAVIIAAPALVVALTGIGSDAWPLWRSREVLVLTVVVGVAYTIYREWLKTTIRQGWT